MASPSCTPTEPDSDSSQGEVQQPSTSAEAVPLPSAPEERWLIVEGADNSGEVGLGLEFSEPAPGDRSLVIRSINPWGFIGEWNRTRTMKNLERRRRTAIPIPVVQEGDHIVQIRVGTGIKTPRHMPARDLKQAIASHSRMDLLIGRISLATASRGLQLQPPPPKRPRQEQQSASESTGPSTVSMSISWQLSSPEELQQWQ